MAKTIKVLPALVKRWLQITTFICTIDATFIVFRPNTLPGGSLEMFFYPYRYYFAVDKMYSDLNDSFVYSQSLLNYCEVVFNIVALYFHYKGSKKAIPMAFTVNVMTFWKTVLYFLVYSFMPFRAQNTFLQELFLVFCPNVFWIVFPFLSMKSLWGTLCEQAGDVGMRSDSGPQFYDSPRARKLRSTPVKKRAA